MTDKIEGARATLDSLATKRRRLAARAAEIAEERQGLALSAHANGDKSAAARLGKLSDEAARVTGDMADLDDALAEARRRVSAAEAEAANEARLAQVRSILPFAAELRGAGVRAAKALAELRAALGDANGAVAKMQDRGVVVADPHVVRVNMKIALDTELMAVGLQHELVAPGRRVKIDVLLDRYASGIEAKAHAILGESKGKKAA